jgi:hypothetical protein
MPVAWVVTLGVCAGSAFAVRDVVFPSLSPSATPSLWQPKASDTTVSSGGVTTAPDRIDVDRTDTSTVFIGIADPTTESTAPEQASAGPTNAGGGSGRPARHSDDTTTTAGSSTSVSSPGTTAPGGGQHPGTTVPKSTTTTDPDTTTSVSQTTNPATGDTLPDDSGSGGSGPGRSGHPNDTLP